MKDSIDFGSMDISTLFRKLLVPTVLGMVFSAIFVITDGIFVGKGIGSDAPSCRQYNSSTFMIATGIGLMFGVRLSSRFHLSVSKVNARQQISTLLRLLYSLRSSY